MNKKDIKDAFFEMKETMESKSSFHKTNQSIYEGKLRASSLGFAIPKKYDQLVESRLGWGKTAIDTMRDDLQFDGFKNDFLGFTRILNDYNAYSAIDSAIKNSMIGACAFITVMPNLNGTPFYSAYTGSEASGIYDSRDGLIYGLVKNSTENVAGIKQVKDYIMFTHGVVHKLNTSGEVINTMKVDTDRMLMIPFVYNQDIASRPFGESRLNTPATAALKSGLRIMTKIEFGHDMTLAAGNILLANGADPSDVTTTADMSTNMTKLLTIFNSGNGELNIESLKGVNTKELQDMLGLFCVNFANAVGMDVTSFGYQPSNGSFGDAATIQMSKPYNNTVDRQKNVYGKSIKDLAIASMSLSTGQYDKDWEIIQPVFHDSIPSSQFGSIADGIGKMSAIVGEANIFNDYIKEKVLGVSVKEEALQVALPSFEVSKKKAAQFINSSSTTIV